MHQRCRFWDRVNNRLRALSHWLTDEDRNHIVAKLATRVPVPTREDHAKLLRYHRSGTSSSARISFLLCAHDVEEIFTPPPLWRLLENGVQHVGMEVINRDVHLGKCAEEARPARAMVEVAGMPRDAKVEISAITVAP
jgi:hypothetical protein